MQYRAATQADAPVIAALHAASWRRSYRGLVSDAYLDHDVDNERRSLREQRFRAPEPGQFTIVAQDDDRVCGFAHSYADHDDQWGTLLDNLHVADEDKRRGIGARLMAETAAWVHTHARQPWLYLWVLEGNHAARGFCERLGGELAGDGIWEPPGGGAVTELRYVWRDVSEFGRRRARRPRGP